MTILVYVDLVFLSGTIIHFFLIRFVSRYTHKDVTMLKMIMCAVFFGVVGVIPIYLGDVVSPVFLLFFCLYVIARLFNVRSLPQLYTVLLSFFMVGVFFAGVLLLFSAVITKMTAYLLILLVSDHLFLRFYQTQSRQQILKDYYYQVEITVDNCTVSVLAFFDTGQQLVDHMTNAAILFIDQKTYQQLFPDKQARKKIKEKRLYYEDINNNLQSISCIKADCVAIYQSNVKKKVEHVLLGIKKEGFHDFEPFNALFGPQMLTLLKHD